MNKLICIGYIALMTGITIGDIGDMPQQTTFSWHLPLVMLAVLAFPAIFGYLAGKDDAGA